MFFRLFIDEVVVGSFLYYRVIVLILSCNRSLRVVPRLALVLS